MNMFKNYENIPENYVPNNQNTYMNDNRLPRKPMEVYNANNELIGYSWVYGDGVTLEFTITGNIKNRGDTEYVEAKDFLVGKGVTFEIYNSRHLIIFTKTLECESNVIKITLSEKESLSIPRDIYTCKLYLSQMAHNERITLFNEDNGYLYVK